MKNRSYLETVDHLITECRERMEKLLNAREIINEVIANNKPAEDLAPAVQPDTPFMTLRRVEGDAPAEKKPRRVISAESKKRREAIRKEILNQINVTSTVTAAGLIKQFGLEDAGKGRKQDIYQLLYDLRIEGILTKNKGSLEYKLNQAQPETSH